MTEDAFAADRTARKRALDISGSFIVRAPAGSGKTELLVQRFLALLACVEAPEQVVAITFTLKAAGEMRTRIVTALREARLASPTTAQSEHQQTTAQLAAAALRADREHGWNLVDNASRLRVQTIDALCLSLVAQMPLLSRLGAMPTPQEDAHELYREAARETVAQLEDPRWAQPVENLLWHLDNDAGKAAGLLAQLLARRDQWLRQRERFDRASLQRALQRLIEERLQQARDAWPQNLLADLSVCVRHAATMLTEAGGDSPVRLLDGFDRLPPAHPDHLPAWQALGHLLLTADEKLRKTVNRRTGFPAPGDSGIEPHERQRREVAKQTMTQLLRSIGDCAGLVAAMVEVKQLPAPEYSDQQWRLIEALSALLPLALAQLELVFQRHGVVDFTYLQLAANQALGGPEAPTDLALALDYRIHHLLIDEFQDTSLSQDELLRRLTAGWQPGDGRTLFVVGDPMQSIYGFRDADVKLFLRAWEDGIGDVALEPLTLSANFRSQAGVVQWVNEIFAEVLPASMNITTAAVPFAASQATRPDLPGAAVRLHTLAAKDGAGEASRVVESIHAAQRERPHGSIAVLVRSRSHLLELVPALKHVGLRFRATEIDVLAQRPAVQDVHALNRALLHPADRVAWLSLLRAPWCGLTLIDLELLAGDARAATIWARMHDAQVLQVLSADGQRRLSRVREALSVVVQSRGRGSLRGRLERAWLRLGGPASVQAPSDLEDVQAYLDLVEGLEQGGDLEDLPALEAQLAKLHAVPDLRADESLQIMTIHKAKGLEFDVVILPGLAGSTRPDDPQLLRWVERLHQDPHATARSDLLLAAMSASGAEQQDPINACVSRLMKEQQRNEDVRLLYVAATRARRQLHLMLAVEDSSPEPGGWKQPPADSLLSRLWPALESRLPAAEAQGASLPALADISKPDPMHYRLRRLPADWQAPPLPAGVDWQPPPLAPSRSVQDGIEFSWVGETLRHVGSVVHGIMQRMGEESLSSWDERRVVALESTLRLALRQMGVPVAEMDGAIARAQRALTAVLSDSRGRWLLSPHAEACSELRLSGMVNGILLNISIDRTFVDEHGVRWIVDYKTGFHQGADSEAFLDNERERYRAQLETYAALLAALDKRPLRLALYFPLLGGWREWGLKA